MAKEITLEIIWEKLCQIEKKINEQLQPDVPTDEPNKEEPKAKKRRADFRFDMVGIRPGEKLVWKYDPKITCTVYDERRIEYEGEQWSLSGLAKRLRGTQSECGPELWMYKGEILHTRRMRFEREAAE